MQNYLPILLMTLIAIIFLFAQYLNYGSIVEEFSGLREDGFIDISPSDGSVLGKLYSKIKDHYPYGDNKGFDYPRIFRRVLIRETPVGTCFALLWIGEKSYIPTFHILLDVQFKPFFICRKNYLDAYVPGLKTVRTIEAHGIILKLNPAFSTGDYAFIDRFVDFVRQRELKRTAITCVNGVITMTPTHASKRDRNRFLNEFIGTVVLASKDLHDNIS